MSEFSRSLVDRLHRWQWLVAPLALAVLLLPGMLLSILLLSTFAAGG